MPATSPPPPPPPPSATLGDRSFFNAGSLWYYLLFLLVAAAAVWRMSYRWDASLIDHHAFRQTQTALSTRTMLEGGPWLAYETPVLGRPWSIPFELPTYHWLVAATALTTHQPLEQAGRLVSVVFFALLLMAIYAGAGLAGVAHSRCLIPVLLVLGSPLYLFWSRAFMIESTALALSAWFLVLTLRQSCADRVSPVAAVGIVTLGMLAALTKITTFIVICFPLGVTLLVLAARRRLRLAAFTALAITAPILAAVAWNWYTDGLKRLNPMAADFITSGALVRWNFGTLAQKTSWSLWENMLSRSVPEVAGVAVAAVIGAAAFLSAQYRWPALVALLTFFCGPALFTNLYAVHNYYFYANGVFLQAFTACGFLALLDLGGRRFAPLVAGVLLPAVLVAMFFAYGSTPYSSVMPEVEHEVLNLAAAAGQHTARGDVIAVYGFDWNPALPYYAHRRAFMDPWSMPVTHPRFLEAMAKLKEERIGAMVVGGPLRGDAAFIRQHAGYYGLSPEAVYRNRIGDVYVEGTNRRE